MKPSHAASRSNSSRPGPAQASTVVLVYQEEVALKRAVELWDRVEQLVGNGVARCVLWSAAQLGSPDVLAEAVAAAAQAEVIVIAVRGAGKLPPLLGAWIDAWLPLRSRREGSLMAVVGMSGQPVAPSDHAQEFLRAVARQGGMDYTLLEHLLPGQPSDAGRTKAAAGAGRGATGPRATPGCGPGLFDNGGPNTATT